MPLNTLWRAKDYAHALKDSGARALVISASLLREFDAIDRAQLPRLEHVIIVGQPASPKPRRQAGPASAIDFDTLLAGGSPALDPEPTHKDAMAFWLYSSGSTGGPKGCVHLQHDMFVCAEAYAKGVLGMRESDRCFSAAKLFFAYGLGNALYMPFAVGATSILLPDPPTAPRVYEIIAKYRPTLLFSVPTNFGMLLSHAHLRQGYGGQPVGKRTTATSISRACATRCRQARRCRSRCSAVSSSDSASRFSTRSARPSACTCSSPTTRAACARDRAASSCPATRRASSMTHDQPVAVGEMGNLLIKGDSTCAYYWNQHEKTKQTIQGEWIRTGDKYYCDADGYYWYGGRSDDMLKAGGIWVSPVEIENVLIDHEAVQECAVIGRDDGHGLSKPFAYVVLKAQVTGSPELAAALQAFVRERLAEYKRPRGVEFVSELPKTATGKLQRFKLRAESR